MDTPVMEHTKVGPAAWYATIAVGTAVFVAAFAVLLLTGTTTIAPSADPGAPRIPLWAGAVPALAAMLLARLVPPRAEVPVPLADSPRRRLDLETRALVAAAVLFPFVATAISGSLWYPLAKILLFLVVPLVVFRLTRWDGPRARAIPAPTAWLAPLPAVAVWTVLSEVVFATPVADNLPDPVTLAVGSLITLLTAGVLEEVFYHGWLQTRLEARFGRWPAIMASSLLFTLMHTGSHLGAETPAVGIAALVAYQGMFGLVQGYLWARYRNIWALIAIHAVANLVYVDVLVHALTG